MTEMIKPAISIIIANYNNGQYIADCIKSLQNQTASNWEAIIIDDCSTDNSTALIATLIQDDARIKLFKNETNQGYQRTLVKGVGYATADIFARLDPDDMIKENTIALSLQKHADHPEVGLVYTNVVFCREDMTPFYVMKCKQVESNNPNFFGFNGEISQFASFKRHLYDQTTGFDTFNRRAEDKDIYMKMYELAPVLHIDEDLYLYRIHGTNASKNENQAKAFFWFWVAIVKASERRNINVENLFLEHFMRVKDHHDMMNKIKSSRWIWLGKKLGFLKYLK